MKSRIKKLVAMMLTVVMLASTFPMAIADGEHAEATELAVVSAPEITAPTVMAIEEFAVESVIESDMELTEEPALEEILVQIFAEDDEQPEDQESEDDAVLTEESVEETAEEIDVEFAGESADESEDITCEEAIIVPAVEPMMASVTEECDHSSQNYREENRSITYDCYDYEMHCMTEKYDLYCDDCGAFIRNVVNEEDDVHLFMDGVCVACECVDLSTEGFTIVTSVSKRWLEPTFASIDYNVLSRVSFRYSYMGCALREAGSNSSYVTDFHTPGMNVAIYSLNGSSEFDGLKPSTTYEYYFKLALSNGTIITTSLSTFTTPAEDNQEVNDTTKPVIDTITSSADLNFAEGTEVTFSTKASDDVALDKIEMYIGDDLVQTVDEDGAAGVSVEISYTTATLTAGTHTVKVVAYDAAGNMNDTSITVEVKEKAKELKGTLAVTPLAPTKFDLVDGYLKVNGQVSFAEGESAADYPDVRVIIFLSHDVDEVYSLNLQQNGAFEINLGKFYEGSDSIIYIAVGNSETDQWILAPENIRLYMFVEEQCDHSAQNYDYVLDTSILPKYVDTGDGVNHYIINSYSCICQDCDGFVKTVEDEYQNADTAAHSYNSDGICVCGVVQPTVDETRPVINPITSSATSSFEEGTEVTFSTKASDDVALDKIEMYIGDDLVQTVDEDGAAGVSVEISYTTATLTVGTHTVKVIAYDAAGNKNDTSISIEVKAKEVADETRPVINPITSSATSSFEEGTEVTFSTKASDDVALDKIEMYIDNNLVQTVDEDGAAGVSVEISYTTATLTVGTHTVKVIAYDAAGNKNDTSISVVVVQAEVEECETHTPAGEGVYVQTIFKAKDATNHYADADVYKYTCSVCGREYGVAFVRGEAQREELPHAWNDKGVCQSTGCGYGCEHAEYTTAWVDGKSKTISITDNEDGATHTHVYTVKVTCNNCPTDLGMMEETITDEAHRVKDGKVSYNKGDTWHQKVTQRVCSCGYAEPSIAGEKKNHSFVEEFEVEKSEDGNKCRVIVVRTCKTKECAYTDCLEGIWGDHTYEKGVCKYCDSPASGTQGWDFSEYDFNDLDNVGLRQLVDNNLVAYGYNGNTGLIISDAIKLAFTKYDTFMYGQLYDDVTGYTSGDSYEEYLQNEIDKALISVHKIDPRVDTSEEFIAQHFYKEALATITGSIYEADPRYNGAMVESIANILKGTGSTSDLVTDDVNKIIELFEMTRELHLDSLANTDIDADSATIQKALDFIDYLDGELRNWKVAGKFKTGTKIAGVTGEVLSAVLNIVTYTQLYNADMSDNIEALECYREAILRSDSNYGIESNSDLIKAIDELIYEYQNMPITAASYLNKAVLTKLTGDALNLLGTPVMAFNATIALGGTALTVAGVADEADARMFSTYAENSTIQMLLGGLASVEEKALKQEWDEMTEEELENYKITAEYCYMSRIIQIDKLITSGAVSGNDAEQLRTICAELEAGLESIRSQTIGVIK